MEEKLSLDERICKLEEQIACIPSIRDAVHRINEKIDIILSKKDVNLKDNQECKPDMQQESDKPNVNITKNQEQILSLIQEGLGDLEISRRLNLSRMGVYKARKKLIDLELYHRKRNVLQSKKTVLQPQQPPLIIQPSEDVIQPPGDIIPHLESDNPYLIELEGLLAKKKEKLRKLDLECQTQ